MPLIKYPYYFDFDFICHVDVVIQAALVSTRLKYILLNCSCWATNPLDHQASLIVTMRGVFFHKMALFCANLFHCKQRESLLLNSIHCSVGGQLYYYSAF